MASSFSDMKLRMRGEVKQVEKVDDAGRSPHPEAPVTPHHYEPTTDEERSLDRRINMKLDLCVVTILSVGFILCGSKLELLLSRCLSKFSLSQLLKLSTDPQKSLCS